MATKAEELAAQFEQASKDFEARIQALSDEQWRAKTPEEGWTVAATAHHAAGGAEPISMMVRAAAGMGEMPPITPDMLNELNAAHAKEFANVSREDTLEVLRNTTGPAADVVRGLTDEQLTRRATLPLGMELSAREIVEMVLIGHLQGHAASIGSAT